MEWIEDELSKLGYLVQRVNFSTPGMLSASIDACEKITKIAIISNRRCPEAATFWDMGPGDAIIIERDNYHRVSLNLAEPQVRAFVSKLPRAGSSKHKCSSCKKRGRANFLLCSLCFDTLCLGCAASRPTHVLEANAEASYICKSCYTNYSKVVHMA